jgi:hypothetical protein
MQAQFNSGNFLQALLVLDNILPTNQHRKPSGLAGRAGDFIVNQFGGIGVIDVRCDPALEFQEPKTDP